jgi:hypothetical protein
MADAATLHTCSAAEGLQSSTQGKCVRTLCAVCSDCLAATRPFALRMALESNASLISQEWTAACGSSGLATAASCAAVAAQIADSGVAVPGNLGKRAAALCTVLGQCTSSSCGGSLQLDTCTVQGAATTAGSMLVPGVSATSTLPFGRCFNTSDCNEGELAGSGVVLLACQSHNTSRCLIGSG